MTTRRRPPSVAATVVVALALAVLALGPAGPASAHTVSDVVAVPAGAATTVSLQPTHGCGDSPTVAVSIRAPVRGAVAGEVAGWTGTALEDEDGTVLEWSGGVLAADAAGRFPVEFTAPDTVGEVLTFPAVQRCENGEELAWIGDDPAGELPAPRVLVLAAGSAPAATIDEVPPDAAGRELLAPLVDADNPDGGAAATGGTEGPAGAEQPPADGAGDAAARADGGADGSGGAGVGGRAEDAAGAAEAGADDDGGGVDAATIGVVLIVVAAVAVALALVLRRRSPSPR